MSEAKRISTNVFINKVCIRCLTWYQQHFPTDRRTYTIKIPFLGFVYSLFAIAIIIYDYTISGFVGLVLAAYLLIALGLGVQLYWGFHIGDRKQYTPWILYKLIEIILIFTKLVLLFTKISYRSDSYIVITCAGIVFLLLDCCLTFRICKKSIKKFKGTAAINHNQEDDNFDDPPTLP